jgi:hypothetical protein
MFDKEISTRPSNALRSAQALPGGNRGRHYGVPCGVLMMR